MPFDPHPRKPHASPHARGRRTLSQKRMSKAELDLGAFLYPERVHLPVTRAACPTVRPCPHVRCRHNTYLDVTGNGSLVLPEHEPEDAVPETSCALDCAAQDGMTLEEVAEVLGIGRERARQIEAIALEKFRAGLAKAGFSEEDLERVLTPKQDWRNRVGPGGQEP